MTCKIDGVPYDAVLTVNIEDSDFSRHKAIQYIEYFKKLVSSNIINAVIYVFPNEDVLQYCGGKDYFWLEYVKIVGSTPNIYHLKMLSQKNMPGKFTYVYSDEKYTEPISDMIPSDALYRIVKYAIHGDNSDYLAFLEELCAEFNLAAECTIMTQKGFCRILPK